MLAPCVFSGALLMDMLPVTQCPDYVRKSAFQWTPETVLVYYCPVLHRRRGIRKFYFQVLYTQYQFSVSALFTKQYRQLFLMFSSVVLNLVLVNSIQKTVPSPNTAGNWVCCRQPQENSLALASLCPLKCLFVCTSSHCVTLTTRSVSCW